jgi:hypothetical protein
LQDTTVQESQAGEENDAGHAPLAAIFIAKDMYPEVLWSQLPFLICSSHMRAPSQPKTALVPLPQSSTASLDNVVGVPRLGILGIRRDAPGSAPLMEYLAQHVQSVEISWLERPEDMAYHPVNIETTPAKKTDDLKR